MDKLSAKIISLITALSISFPLLATGISGRIIDENGDPVEFADIVVKTATSQSEAKAIAAGITDGNGAFSIDLGSAASNDDARFILEASSVGYQTLTISCGAEDLGELTMPHDYEQLEAVTVKAQRVVQKAGQFLVVPDPKDVRVASKGLDLLALQQLPGLRVDQALQSITIDGGTPILKINGREVSATRIINLNPAKVKRIEYSNSPGLRYLDRGANGVINIVLKEPDDGGSIYFDGSTDPKLMMSDAYLSGSYHKGKSEFELNYNFSRRNYQHGPSEDVDSYISPERVVERETKSDKPVHYMMNIITGEYTFQPNDSTMFVASLKNALWEARNGGTGTMLKTDRGVSTTMEVTEETPYNSFQPTLDLFYSQKFAKGRKFEMNVVGEYSRIDESRTITYNTGGSSAIYPTDISNKGWALSAEAVYSRQFSKIGTRYGVQYQHNYANNNYKVSNVVSEMTKDNTYIFVQAEGAFGEKANWSVGTGAKIFLVNDGNASKTYVRNLSTAQLNWRMSERWSLTGEVRYTPNLPTLGDLSPVFQRTDDVEAAKGNAELRPSQLLDNRLMIRFAAKNGWYANFQGGYRHSFDDIITTFSYDPATDLFVSCPQNAEYSNSAYLHTEAGVKNLFEHFNISLYATVKHEQSKGEGFHHINDNLGISINVQGVWEKFLVGAYFNLKPEWTLSGEFLGKSEPGQNIYAQYKWKNLTAHLNWHCPFNPNGYSYETVCLSETHPLQHINWTSDNGNMIVLGLTWNLDFGKAFNKGSKTLYNGGYDAGTVK